MPFNGTSSPYYCSFLKDCGEKKMEISKDFPLEIEQLFNAWINIDELKHWWRPLGSKLIDGKNDVKENGNFEYKFHQSETNHSFSITGKYSEATPNEKLIYSWNWKSVNHQPGDGQFQLTVSFEKLKEGSRITILQENLIDHEELQPHEKGWEKSLDDLYSYLVYHKKPKDSTPGHKALTEEQRSGGYR